MQRWSFHRTRYLIGLIILGLLLSSCRQVPTAMKADSVPETGQDTSIKIGSKDFTEEFLVAEMYAQMLEAVGFKVERNMNLGSTPVMHTAIVRGDLDLYPEYTSTALLTVLKQQPHQDPQETYNRVKNGYEQQFKLTWLDPAPFNDTQALAVTADTATLYGIKTFSDLAKKAPELVLGGPTEFFEREDGLKGLQQAYGGFQFKDVLQLGTGSLRYQALKNGQIDAVVAFSTDGQIQGNNLVMLKDDKHFYPVYNIAPVVRMDTLQKNPKLAQTLNRLAPLLTDSTMASLNWQVDGPARKEPAEVARNFLKQNGLIQ